MSVAVLGRRSCGVGDPWAVRRRTWKGLLLVPSRRPLDGRSVWGRAGPGHPSAPPARLRYRQARQPGPPGPEAAEGIDRAYPSAMKAVPCSWQVADRDVLDPVRRAERYISRVWVLGIRAVPRHR